MESVVALFREPAQAQGALEALKARGFERDHLGFAMTDVVAQNSVAQATGVSPEQGQPAGSGAILKGGLIGALASLALTVPVWVLLMIIPDTRIYADGGLTSILFGLIAGLGLGILFGALSGSDHGDFVNLLRRMGVPGPQAEKLYGGLKNGHTLVIARDPSGRRADEALSLMRKYGALRLEDVIGGGQLQSERLGQSGH